MRRLRRQDRALRSREPSHKPFAQCAYRPPGMTVGAQYQLDRPLANETKLGRKGSRARRLAEVVPAGAEQPTPTRGFARYLGRPGHVTSPDHEARLGKQGAHST